MGTTTNAQPSAGKDAVELLHRPAIVGDVLEDMAADDDIERLVRELEVGHIQSQFDVISVEIRGSIAGTQTLTEQRLEAALRCKMQDTLRPRPSKRSVSLFNRSQTNRSRSSDPQWMHWASGRGGFP